MLFAHWLLLIIIGLCLGSFIALVADRYPLMLYRSWNITPQDDTLRKKLSALPSCFNLVLPRSHCCSCQHTLPWYHTIPLLSFIFLRGTCAFCEAPIPRRTLIIEIISALLCSLAVALFGWTPHACMIIVLYLSLLTLTFIDLEHQLLPDTLTLAILWIGLMAQTLPYVLPLSATDAISGATLGYLLPWLVGSLFKLYRKKTGLGLGDCKLLAAIGTWCGPMNVLLVLFASACIGLLVALILIACRKLSKNSFIPFGPFIATTGAAIISLQWLGHPVSLL